MSIKSYACKTTWQDFFFFLNDYYGAIDDDKDDDDMLSIPSLDLSLDTKATYMVKYVVLLTNIVLR